MDRLFMARPMIVKFLINEWLVDFLARANKLLGETQQARCEYSVLTVPIDGSYVAVAVA